MKHQSDRIILISGASSGIGFCIAEELANDGNHVYAGVRSDNDLNHLSQISNITPVKLDVTDNKQIEAVVSKIEKETGYLDVLINNAGVTGWGAVVDRGMEYVRRVFEVNYFANVQMVKSFYPLLEKSQNRPIIINISSQGGNYAFPFWSVYHSTKWALEAFSHSLRRELAPLGIRVSIIQPGAIKSMAFTKDKEAYEQYLEQSSPEFKENAERMLGKVFNEDTKRTERSPLLVANAVRKAINSQRTKIYYQPGRRLIPDWIMSVLPYGVVDKIFRRILK